MQNLNLIVSCVGKFDVGHVTIFIDLKSHNDGNLRKQKEENNQSLQEKQLSSTYKTTSVKCEVLNGLFKGQHLAYFTMLVFLTP